MIVLLSAPALRLSETVASAALRLRVSVAAVLAAALLPSASVVLAASCVSARSALVELVLIDSDSCSMRELSRSAAARLRSSICWTTASARPTRSCSSWPIRLSSVLATSSAPLPSVESIVGDALADGVGELGRARIDQRRDVADALVDGGDDLLAAVGERLGDVHDAGRQGIGEGLRAAVERFLEAVEALIEARW